MFKRKQHQATAFRSFESLGYASDSLALVNNMRLAGEDVFQRTSAIFARPMPKGPASSSCLLAGREQ